MKILPRTHKPQIGFRYTYNNEGINYTWKIIKEYEEEWETICIDSLNIKEIGCVLPLGKENLENLIKNKEIKIL